MTTNLTFLWFCSPVIGQALPAELQSWHKWASLPRNSSAVVKHFRNSCGSFKMLLLLLIFYHLQVPLSKMDFLSHLGSVESLSTTVKDDWIHYTTRSMMKDTCNLVTLRSLRGQNILSSSEDPECMCFL